MRIPRGSLLGRVWARGVAATLFHGVSVCEVSSEELDAELWRRSDKAMDAKIQSIGSLTAPTALELALGPNDRTVHLIDPPCGTEPDGHCLFVRWQEAVNCPACRVCSLL